MRFGMIDILDTEKYGNFTMYQYGVQRALDEFQVVLDIHNVRMAEMMARFVSNTTEDKRYQFSGFDEVKMIPRDRQFGISAPQVANMTPYDLGVRVDSADVNLEWTERAFLVENVNRINKQMNAMLTADRKWIEKLIKIGLLDNTNYIWNDTLTKGEVLPIMSLLNGDNHPVPQGPTGIVYVTTGNPAQGGGSVQNHFKVVSALSASNIQAAYMELAEHVDSGKIVAEINYTDAAAWLALTGPDGLPLLTGTNDVRLLLATTKDVLIGDKTDSAHPFERLVGIIKNTLAEVWIRPYVDPGYTLWRSEGGNLDNPLVGRKDIIDSADLQVLEPSKLNPELHGRTVRRTWGCSILERRNGVIVKVDPALGAYSAPVGFTKADYVKI